MQIFRKRRNSSLFLFFICLLSHGEEINISEWQKYFSFSYDYVLREDAGIDRKCEPVELTLSTPESTSKEWTDEIRVVRLVTDSIGKLVLHQVLSKNTVEWGDSSKSTNKNHTESANIIFLVSCNAFDEVRYRIFWKFAAEVKQEVIKNLPQATPEYQLKFDGSIPGIRVENEYYSVSLDPRSGGIKTARMVNTDEEHVMFYHTIPIHFAVDVWSPPARWDHDYDWESPPNQKLEAGPIAIRYHRWGPLSLYKDVIASISYTFYAQVPWIHVSALLYFKENRSARAVRLGEIVVSHSRLATPNEQDVVDKSQDIFTHYAWLGNSGEIEKIDVNAHRDEGGRANLENLEPGALAILDWDIPWVAGWNEDLKYGLATLRKNHFMGNLMGNSVPVTAPCTYVANYGWGFTYWSRPYVYPLGKRDSKEDMNTVVPGGTLFASEEALLFFKPDDDLTSVRNTYVQFKNPLKHVYRGTGPW